jgi:hypothetical protein
MQRSNTDTTTEWTDWNPAAGSDLDTQMGYLTYTVQRGVAQNSITDATYWTTIASEPYLRAQMAGTTNLNWNDFWNHRYLTNADFEGTPGGGGNAQTFSNAVQYGLTYGERPINYAYRAYTAVTGGRREAQLFAEHPEFHDVLPSLSQTTVICKDIGQRYALSKSPFDHVPSLMDMINSAAGSFAWFGNADTSNRSLVKEVGALQQNKHITYSLKALDDTAPPIILANGGKINLIKQIWKFTFAYQHEHPYSLINQPVIAKEFGTVSIRVILVKAPSFQDGDAHAAMIPGSASADQYNTTLDRYIELFEGECGFTTGEVAHGFLHDARDLHKPVNKDIWGVVDDKIITLNHGERGTMFISANHQYKYETEFYGQTVARSPAESFPTYDRMKQNRIFPIVIVRYPGKPLKNKFEAAFMRNGPQNNKNIWRQPLVQAGPSFYGGGTSITGTGRLYYNSQLGNDRAVLYSHTHHRGLHTEYDPYFDWDVANTSSIAGLIKHSPGMQSHIPVCIGCDYNGDTNKPDYLHCNIVMGFYLHQHCEYMVNYM